MGEKEFRDKILFKTIEQLDESIDEILEHSKSNESHALGLFLNNIMNLTKIMNFTKDDESFVKAVGEIHDTLDEKFFRPLGMAQNQIQDEKPRRKVYRESENDSPRVKAIEVHVIEGNDGELEVELSEDLSDAPDEVKHGLAQQLANIGVKPQKIKRILGGY